MGQAGSKLGERQIRNRSQEVEETSENRKVGEGLPELQLSETELSGP